MSEFDSLLGGTGKSDDDFQHELDIVSQRRAQPFRKPYKSKTSAKPRTILNLPITGPSGMTGVLSHLETDEDGQLVAKVRWGAEGRGAFGTYPARWVES